MSEKPHSDLRIPAGLRVARFNILDRVSILAKEATQRKEDEAIFREIARMGCPEGCILIEDEREEP